MYNEPFVSTVNIDIVTISSNFQTLILRYRVEVSVRLKMAYNSISVTVINQIPQTAKLSIEL